MRWVLIAIAVCLSFDCIGSERVCGLERMERFDLLPVLQEGTKVLQVSSRDRLGGNDGDGYFGTHAFLYEDVNGEKVLFDEQRPGCLYRFWMTFTSASVLTNQLRFYFDGESSPSIEISVGDFFGGSVSPFLFPLVGDAAVSCKGYYSYYPFVYEQGLKVTISSVPTASGYNASPFYYNITYHQYDSAVGLQTWDGSEDVSSVVNLLSQTGADPKSTVGNGIHAGSISLSQGESQELFSRIGEGAVQSIKLKPNPASLSVLRDCVLQMNWDGGSPEVDVPLGCFFGSATNEMDVLSLPIGMSVSEDYYCFFPMPFWTSAVIEVVNNGATPVTIPFEIQYTTHVYDQARSGYFHALHKEQYVISDGNDVNFIEAEGRGHVVGLSLFIRGDDFTGNNLDHLEGDERIYFDGSASPSIYGTGTEDYFNCAWYFYNPPALLPFHGCALQQFNSQPPNGTQAYRFHISDTLPFNQNIKFGMEHGRANDTRGLYSSVAYFYMQNSVGQEEVAVFDVLEGSSFDYQVDGVGIAVSNSWSFEGDDDQAVVGLDGIAFTNASSFWVPVSINAGVILRRTTDRGVGGQKASVFVDERFAGTWYDADFNFLTARLFNTTNYVPVHQRWYESDFMIPATLTAGKSNVFVRVVKDADGASIWNEYRYKVFQVIPLASPEDVDLDGLPDAWEVKYFNNIGEVSPLDDEDKDGFSAFDEYVSVTSPVDAASRFELGLLGDDGYGFYAHGGRVYEVLSATNLVSGSWSSVTNFSGDDSLYQLNASGDSIFYRVQVRLGE